MLVSQAIRFYIISENAVCLFSGDCWGHRCPSSPTVWWVMGTIRMTSGA